MQQVQRIAASIADCSTVLLVLIAASAALCSNAAHSNRRSTVHQVQLTAHNALQQAKHHATTAHCNKRSSLQQAKHRARLSNNCNSFQQAQHRCIKRTTVQHAQLISASAPPSRPPMGFPPEQPTLPLPLGKRRFPSAILSHSLPPVPRPRWSLQPRFTSLWPCLHPGGWYRS